MALLWAEKAMPQTKEAASSAREPFICLLMVIISHIVTLYYIGTTWSAC